VLPVGPLHPDGRWLKDATGRTVIVHGLELARKTAPYRPPAASFTERDAEAIQRWGFDAVRLAWFWKGVEPERGQIDRGYIAELDRIGDLLARHDVFTLLEAHQDGYNERLGGAGFPDWATVGEPPPNPNGLLGEATWAAFGHLYANDDGLADSFAGAWRQMAAAFADNPKMLGYDLVNEPGAGTASPGCLSFEQGCAAFDRGTLQPFQDRVAAAIRTVDPTTIAFYEPNIFHDVGARSRLGPPPASSGPSGFAFHAYCLNRFLNPLVDHESQAPGYASCAPSDATTFAHAVATADEMGVPPLFAEFGDTQDLDDITRMIDLADEHLTGWMYWGYKDWDDDPGGQGSGPLFDDSDHDGTLRPDKLAALSRPYAMATAGTPLSSHYDREHRTFEYEYAPDPAVSAPTVLFTSPVNNPRGYRVEVDGARVVSRPGATYLQLQPQRGATHVTVRVVGSPGGTPTEAAEAGVVLPVGPATDSTATDSTATDPTTTGPTTTGLTAADSMASNSMATGLAGAVSHTCARNVGAPDHIDLAAIAPAGGQRLVGRLESDGGRGSVTGPDAVSTTFAAGDVAWFDLGAARQSGGRTVDLLCRVGGRATFTVGPAPTVPATFDGRSTHNTNVSMANSRLPFEVTRPGHYVADVRVTSGAIRLGLRRDDGSMPAAALLTSSATVDLGVLRRGSASLDVVAVPGPAAAWTVSIRPAR
jgi:endoglycosylceramidase